MYMKSQIPDLPAVCKQNAPMFVKECALLDWYVYLLLIKCFFNKTNVRPQLYSDTNKIHDSK